MTLTTPNKSILGPPSESLLPAKQVKLEFSNLLHYIIKMQRGWQITSN